MNKEAGIINKAFATMDVVDGSKRVKDTYKKSITNKFDSTMGNVSNCSGPDNMGSLNAAISNPNKLASEQLDILYKQAMPSISSLKNGLHRGFVKSKYIGRKIDKQNSRHISNMMSGIKNGKVNQTLKEGLKAGAITIPAAAGMVGSGIATSKGLSKIDEKVTKKEIQPDRKLEYNVIGAGVTTGLVLSAINKKKLLAPYALAGRAANDGLIKMPVKALKNSKAGKVVAETLKNSASAMNKANNQIIQTKNNAEQNVVKVGKDLLNIINNNKSKNLDNQQAASILIKRRKNDFFATQKAKGVPLTNANKLWEEQESLLNNHVKKALANIEKQSATHILSDMEKLAGKTDYLKDVFKNHFLKEGVKSIPYYGAPAVLSMGLSTDLRHGLKKIDHVDEKKNDINNEKTASNIKLPSKEFSKEMFEKGVDGLARTVFPATAMAVTGRNITNAFEKIDNSNRNMQEDMANKIIIQVNGGDSKRKIKRNVNKELDNSLFKKAEENINKTIIDNIRSNISSITKEKHSDSDIKKKIFLGKKKQFRMNM